MTFGTRPRRSSRPWQDAQQILSEKDQRSAHMGMDRLGIEPGLSHMLSGCDATTPTAPELMRPRVLNYLLGTAFRAEDPPVRPFFFLSAAGALLWLALAVGKRVRPGKALQHLQGTVFKLCHGPPVRPFFFLSAAGALLWLVLAVGKRVRARPFGLLSSFLLPAHSFGWCSL